MKWGKEDTKKTTHGIDDGGGGSDELLGIVGIVLATETPFSMFPAGRLDRLDG